jgi:hypothetical protein
MSELKIEELLHPDYVERLMQEPSERLVQERAFDLINQRKDLQKAMRDMNIILMRLLYHYRALMSFENNKYVIRVPITSVTSQLICEDTLYGAIYKAYIDRFN